MTDSETENELTVVPAHNSQLNSDTESDDGDNAKTRDKPRAWQSVKVLKFEEVNSFLDAEPHWSKMKPIDSSQGLRYEYRCNKCKSRGPQCSAAMYLLYHKSDTNVSLFKTIAEHDHDRINQTTQQYGISKDTKKFIDELLKLTTNWTPKAIVDHITNLQKSSHPELTIPMNRQVRNYLAMKREKTVVLVCRSLL